MSSKRTYQDESLGNVVVSIIAAVLAIEVLELDVCQSFIFHGGHSLTAISLSAKCRSNGIRLSAETILQSVSIAELADLASPINGHYTADGKRQRRLSTLVSNGNGVSPPIPKPNHSFSSSQTLPLSGPNTRLSMEECALTEMQMALLSSSQKDPGVNMIQFLDTFLSTHIPLIKEAWRHVIEMEPIFGLWQSQTCARETSTKVSKNTFNWSDTSCKNLFEYHATLDAFPTETSMATHFRAVTWEQGSKPGITTIVWNVHHACVDGFSASLIYQKVRRFAEGQNVQAGRSFSEVGRELKLLQDSLSMTHQKFWAQQKSNFPHAGAEILLPRPTSTLLTDPPVRTLPVALAENHLLAFCRQHGVTVASLHYSAWSIVLSKYTDCDSVIFGCVVSGRDLPIEGVQETIGPLINTLPFYTSIVKTEQCLRYIRTVFQQMTRLGAMQTSTPQDGYSRHFSSAIAMEVKIEYSEAAELKPVSENSFRLVSDIPITILVRPDGTADLSYRTALYAHADIELLVEQYSNAVASLIVPDNTIGQCMNALLPQRCKEFVHEASNFESFDATLEASSDDLVTLFEAAAAKYPTAVAVQKAGKRLSYAELDHLVGQVADHLRRLIKAGEVICVHADRSINWIVAIYGILKAGGVYTPFEPSLPQSMRESNYQTANGCMYLTPRTFQKIFAPPACDIVLSVEEMLTLATSHLTATTESHHRQSPQPAATAYICFTSGSTGKPKGVICHHGGLVAFQRNEEVRLFAKPGCRIAQMMSPAFDGSIHEIFSALSYGATLVLPDSDGILSHLSEATSSILTPSLANVINPNDYPLLQNVYLVGEPVSQQINDAWARSKNLYNMYGPTEATCGATIKKLERGKPVTVGRPNPSSRVYILDRNREACSPGVIGDIYIAGVQVTKGYVNRPEETAQRFLPDSLRSTSKERMYQTGDRGYWDSSMELHCLGRTDRQIKLHGFRLDLNVLEEQISNDVPEISAIALFRKADYLAAAVQPEHLDLRNLKSRLTQTLPLYAQPKFFVPLDRFPTTAAGKLDYTALSSLVTFENNDQTPIRWAKTERMIANTWRDILQLDPRTPVSPASSFVALGGHSVSQLVLVSRLSALFRRPIPLQMVLETESLRELAAEIDRSTPPVTYDSQKSGRSHMDENRISGVEAEWAQKYQLKIGCSAFNVSAAWVFDPNRIDRHRLEFAWNNVLDRHSILRCYYVGSHAQTAQRKYHNLPPRVRCVESVNILEEINRPFDIREDHLIRVTISSHQVVVSISHIICDLTALRTLLSEVANLYLDTPSHPVRRLSEPSVQSCDSIHERNLRFWSEYLQKPPSMSFLGRTIISRRTYCGDSNACRLPGDLLLRLRKFACDNGCTLHQLGLAAVSLASQPEAKDIDVILGAPYMNRRPEDMEKIGLFLEPLPVRISHQFTDCCESIKHFMSSVRRSSQLAITHAVPWSRLLQHLGVVPDFPNHPLFDAMVTFHDNRSTHLLTIPNFQRLHTWSVGSKFKLMFEFSVLSDEDLMLRIEYDDECFTVHEILRLQVLVIEALVCLVSQVTLSELRERLRSEANFSDEVSRFETVTVGSPV